MERVWKRVQSAGRRGASSGRCGCSTQPCQLHVDQRAKRGGGGGGSSAGSRKSRGPQTIVCGCQVQPCPVHPVLIRVRRTRPLNSCDCPPESQPCSHPARASSSRRVKRCDCTERPCRHNSSALVSRRRPQGSFSLPMSSASAVLPSGLQHKQHGQHCGNPSKSSCECPEGPCPHASAEGACECEAKPCSHTIKSRRTRRTCDCAIQPCSHVKNSEGRIKRVKYRVRRAGCAMARCTAELAMLKLHWELATECAPCKPRAFTRRLCRRQQSDNELYRSNSFKFERFERTKDDCSSPTRRMVFRIRLLPYACDCSGSGRSSSRAHAGWMRARCAKLHSGSTLFVSLSGGPAAFKSGKPNERSIGTTIVKLPSDSLFLCLSIGGVEMHNE